jgi:uncharacterized protein with HEPN domain
MEKDPTVYVRHILEAIANIETDIAGYDFEKFRTDRRTRQLVERNLEILSEASRRLPNEYKDREAQISWRAIAGIGNVLRHDYHQTYPTVLWDTCKNDLKPLKDAALRIDAAIAITMSDARATKNID